MTKEAISGLIDIAILIILVIIFFVVLKKKMRS